MLDLTPATDQLIRVIRGVDDDDLDRLTPCQGLTVGGLLDHVDGLAGAFAAAARKDPVMGPPSADRRRLSDDWRARIPERLTDLASAWTAGDAWQGMTEAGGVSLPGEMAASVAIDEVIVHGWDLATATGQYFEADPELLQVAYSFVQDSVEQNPAGTPGLFGPPVPVPDDAPLLHRLLGLTGRDPGPVPEAVSRTGRGTAASTATGNSQPMAWSIATRTFAEGGWFWLATVHPDGRPHVMPVFAAWSAPVFYVASKDTTRKSRNLAADRRCVLTKDSGDLHIVIEADARQVADADGLDRASAAFHAVYGWPTTVSGSELDAPFGAPTSGGPPYQAYEITPHRAFAFPTDGESTTPTRWRFDQ